MKYELFYLIGESKKEELETIKQKIKEIVEKNGGVFYGSEFSQSRKMSYEIKKEIRGTYIAQRFEIKEVENEAPNIGKINEKLNLLGDILRFIIVKADELPELTTLEERRAPKENKEKKVFKKEGKEERKKPADLDKKLDEILNI